MERRIEREDGEGVCFGTTWILMRGGVLDITTSTEHRMDYEVGSLWGPGETREGELGCSGVRSPGSAFFTERW